MKRYLIVLIVEDINVTLIGNMPVKEKVIIHHHYIETRAHNPLLAMEKTVSKMELNKREIKFIQAMEMPEQFELPMKG